LMKFVWRCTLVFPIRSATKNLKIRKYEKPTLWTAAILKIEKNVISHMSNYDKILHGDVELASRP